MIRGDGQKVQRLVDQRTCDRLEATRLAIQMREQRVAELPAWLLCPFTSKPMYDAIFLPCCGITVSNEAALLGKAFFSNEASENACVKCGSVLRVDDVVQDRKVRQLVKDMVLV